MILNIVLYVLLFVSIFLFIYSSFIVGMEFKKRRYINDFLGNLNDKYQKRLKLKEAKALYQGDTEDKKIIDMVDELIERSSIRIILPFMTSEIFIILSLVFSIVIAILFYKTYPLFIFAIFTGISNLLLIVILMRLMARITYDKIDDQVLAYINTLDNLCDSNDDIITIIEKAIPYIKEPLKQYSQQFVFECRKGIPLEKAFRNFEDRIESKRFRQLLKNLEVCSKHDANYKKVLGKSRVIMKRYFEQKAKRRKAISQGRKDISLTILMGVIIIYIVSGFNPNLKNVLLQTPGGNVILGYNILVLLIGVYKVITLDKINY